MRKQGAVVACVAGALALAGCEGTHDLAKRNCLPLQVPADVVLRTGAELWKGNDGRLYLYAIDDRDKPMGDGALKAAGAIAAGSTVHIDGLEQEWGFDSGDGPIFATGRTADGQDFVFSWGYYDKIWPAPWETPVPGGEPHLPRQVQCKE